MMKRVAQSTEFFLAHEVRSFLRYIPDVEALRTLEDRVVLAGGEEDRDRLTYRPAVVLADRLGERVVDFPGKHVGYVSHSAPFAKRLAELLG